MFIALALIAAANVATDFRSDLRSCGIDQSRAIVEHPEDLDDRETGISGSAPVSDDQMRCIAGAAARRGYFIEFADPALNARFLAQATSQMREAGRKLARDWLAQHNLLDQLPVYDPGREKLDAFAVRVEHMCSFAPHTGLRLEGAGTLTLVSWTGRSDAPFNAKVECLLMALGAADLESGGARFGFVGDETSDPSAP